MRLVWILVLASVACKNSDSGKEQEANPWVVGLELLPDPAYEADTLECTWESLRIAETATVAWEINEQLIDGLDSTTLSGAWFNRRDQVACRVTADHDSSPSYISNVVWIRNSPPVVEQVTLSPEDPVEGDILRADAVVTDPDGEDEAFVELHYRWFVDEEEVGEDQSILGSAYFDEDQVVEVEVWATDGLETGEALRSEGVTVANTPPTEPEVMVEATSSGLLCSVVTESEDLDPADTVSYSYAWWEFGQSVGGANSTLGAADIRAGGAYSCRVTPSDGDEDGEAGWAHITKDGDVLRYRWTFNDAGAYAGSKMVVMPDYDGDGLDDLLIATIDSSVVNVEAGGAVLFSSSALGETSELGQEAIEARLLSMYGFASAGYDLDLVPDYDGDGLPEVAVAAPGYKDGQGLAMVVPSAHLSGGGDTRMEVEGGLAAFTNLRGFEEAEGVGTSVASADVDGDGYGEFAVGVRDPMADGRGSVKLFWGEAVAQERTLYMDDAMTYYDGDGGEFGADIAFLPGEDGTPKYLAIGAPGLASGAGGVVIHDVSELEMRSSSEALHPTPTIYATFELEGETAGDALGSRLEAIELDDGSHVLAIGAPGASGGAGAFYFWSPEHGEDLALCSAILGSGDEGIGLALSQVGDANGDGSSELLVGAPGADTTFENAGAVYVVSIDPVATGTDAFLPGDAVLSFYGEAADDQLGTDVVGSLDWGQGGLPGFAMGAPGIVQPVDGFEEGGVLIWVDY